MITIEESNQDVNSQLILSRFFKKPPASPPANNPTSYSYQWGSEKHDSEIFHHLIFSHNGANKKMAEGGIDSKPGDKKTYDTKKGREDQFDGCHNTLQNQISLESK
ncbi:hypothetical protein PT300_13230 [Enterobacteriaceae bacterium ESL0689]|nr:hypothetical protein [Enterobacteriaceae bacterium ESL0689]